MLRQELDRVSWRPEHLNKVISWKVYLWWNSIYTNRFPCLLSEHSVQFSCLVVSNFLRCHGLQHGQASLSITNSWSLPKLMSIESMMPSNHRILSRPLLLLPSIFPSIRVFSKESVLRIRWPKYWSFSFSISSSSEYSGLIFFGWTGWISLLSKGLSRVFCNTTVQKHLFFGAQSSLASLVAGFPGSSDGNESACNIGDLGSIQVWVRKIPCRRE